MLRRINSESKHVVRLDHPTFGVSVNGRNGFETEHVYVESKVVGPNGVEERVVLGQGSFGVVYRASHKFQTNVVAAIKVAQPSPLDVVMGPLISYDDVEQRCQEVRTLLKLRNDKDAACRRHLLQLYEYFWDGNELHLVLELLPSNLQDNERPLNLREWTQQRQDARGGTPLSEDEVRVAATSILNGLHAMHGRNIVHRDVKESNVLFGLSNDLSTLKLCDFALALDLTNDSVGSNSSAAASSNGWNATMSSSLSSPMLKTTGFSGTYGYLAPEIYECLPYGCEVDLFSFGVLMFRLLSGNKPWQSCDCPETRLHTCNAIYTLDGVPWDTVSASAKRLIQQLLTPVGTVRITAQQALQHEWISGQDTSSANEAALTVPSGEDEIKCAVSKARWKRMAWPRCPWRRLIFLACLLGVFVLCCVLLFLFGSQLWSAAL